MAATADLATLYRIHPGCEETAQNLDLQSRL